MKVAVCDGDQQIRDQLEACLLNHMEGIKQCDGYEDIQSLMKSLDFKEENYRLVILALVWDGEPLGLEAGRRICQLSPQTRILWMCESPGAYIQQVFLEPVNLLGLMAKPVDPEILELYIQKLLQEEMTPAARHLLIRNRGVAVSVRFSEILYLESSGHLVAVQTKDDHYLCYGRLEKFLEQLPEYFVQCHKSYIVNMKEISRLEKGGILMEQGVVVPVSKSRYSTTKKKYFRFMDRTRPNREEMAE